MSDSDSEYETEDNTLSFVLHNAAEAGDVETLEKMLGLAEPGSVPVAMAVLLRRLLNMGDANECTPVHLAIINAHPGCVDALLRAGSSPTKACDGNPPLCLAACLPLGPGPQRTEAGHAIARLLLERGVDPHDRDDGGRTALHWAAASGHTGLLSLLLSGAVAAHRRKLVALLGDSVLEGGLPPLERPEHILSMTDHDGFTALHLAAKFGHADAAALLLRAATESAAAAAPAAAEAAEELAAMAAAAAARAAAEAEAAAAADGAEGVPVAAPPPPAARPAPPPPPSAEALAALFPVAEAPSLYKIKTRSEGQTALQLAALHGRAEAVGALLAGAGQLKGLTVTDKKGRTAEVLARRRGHTVLAAALQAVAAGQPFDMTAAAATVAAADGAATAGAPSPGTLLLAPPDCLLHRTAPEPMARGAPEPPPENVHRLHVLTQQDYGILHNREFDGALRWRAEGVPPAAMVDVLKCHEWSYIRTVMQACEAIPDSPSAVGSLDMDTAISRHSMRAALAAAGAVCAAVDEVVGGKARNAFCAVRPPGHHAGPTGVVTNPNDAAGSHGFCLLSNVAIGAAYAMNVHRHAGIKRVAILDFDVHHGNGTQACVLNTSPTVRTVAIRTPYSEGVQRFPTYKPWMGDGDTHNILFASVQGYGKRGGAGWFYPGSGATADSTIATALAPPQEEAAGTAEGGAAAAAAPAEAFPAQAPSATEGAAAAPPATPAPGHASGSGDGQAAGGSGAGAGSSGAVGPESVPEDPDGEFRGSYDVTVVGGPRVINVGVPGPGGKPRMWRRAWRDKILPALYNFKPDLIIVSAGFDAHKKEDLNLRYVGITEYDYEWLTGQIVEVANACCRGRLVSVLEGGYNLRGGPVGSAFARSVAAHVRALAAPCAAPFEPRDAEVERAAEKAAEAKKAQRVLAAAGLTPLAAAKAAAAALATPRTQPPAAKPTDTPSAAAPMEVDAAAAAGGGCGDADEPSAKRRRRPAVDYAALNAQMEAEAAAGAGGSGAGAGAGAP